MRNARQSIELSANYAGGKEYREALKLMAEAMDRNPELKVHLLYHTILMDSQDKKETLQIARDYPDQFFGVELAMETRLVDSVATIENHMKILVVDGKYFVVGGTSLEEGLSTVGLEPGKPRETDFAPKEFTYSGSRDMDIVGYGPMAETLRKAYFLAHARFERLVLDGNMESDDAALEPHSRYYPIDPSQAAQIDSFEQVPDLVRGAPIKLTLGGPFDGNNKITQEYIRLVQSANKSIDIGNLYFMPQGGLLGALLDAGNRDIAITVTTNGVHDRSPFPTELFAWGSRYNYYALLTGVELEPPDYFFADEIPPNNVHIYEYYVQGILYHKKVMVVDGKTMVIGSYNLGGKSDRGDFELVLTIESEEAAQKALRVLDVDHAHSKEPSRTQITEFNFAPWYMAMGRTQLASGGLY
jgi:phosphatidylserine/phosphatidylglycerophosphate/cardiolipin synthase-like enzyme